ncbi:Protein-tyrosine phosphatase, receptor/non-receptor type domain and Protein-tyrosine/Dual specificity phosphatase domain and Protein-tyrosine phosphatase, catalytic domain-containing protein [Strongyloides ratti]|uniref:Protein-tyrosine phosphatase, receptor/non-receptor type domain and Protein-tyrosine/Dual specificity phosphatase domain and Protein-tyrosine phosphatase, catalytic domain-containing protein n=1 Tax=Strongyloides ratti TaxID=34506 RepID=A0A090L862_STRRB|nr:Protein-tyrosine phosphatase, receptor/non-receptor type domain and Protein-tyrosine/Dual specificity phosphatase domain and Protein-tyrosine phosphatase, catalytic domain-containing protein [Strongyloides ratti]CEF65986.1 Protein-tyrosine phosphatase, receptor/non-receptor type domain and Protein-tyrosine/Dual specificity phosphatase domain and Protein-tyrosine phosphatase, catalytic domain-containing protein [Strongyloides ratti]
MFNNYITLKLKKYLASLLTMTKLKGLFKIFKKKSLQTANHVNEEERVIDESQRKSIRTVKRCLPQHEVTELTPSISIKKESKRQQSRLTNKKKLQLHSHDTLSNKPKKLKQGLDGNAKKSPKEMAEMFTEFAISKEIKGLKDIYEQEFNGELKIVFGNFIACNGEKNVKKNRNKEIPCLDSSRVRLIINDGSDSDYIHANYLPTSIAGDRMILTQAPMSYTQQTSNNGQSLNLTTATDFYRMLEQEESEYVIMLCKFGEDKDTLCYQYIPTNGTINIGQYKITLLKRETMQTDNNIVLSTIQYCRGENKLREFTHIQYMNWPKEGFPQPWELTPITVYSKVKDSQKPIVIHCTSGVRKTCTIAGIFMALDEFENGTLPNSFSPIIKHLRTYRFMAVRTPIEFLYMHLQLIHYFLHKQLIDSTQKLLSFFDDYDPAHRKQALKEKETKCISAYGLKSASTPQTNSNQQT